MKALERSLEALGDVAACADLPTLQALLQKQVNALGFDALALGELPEPAGYANSWPVPWLELYLERRLVRIDPLVREARERLLPFTLDDITAHRALTRSERLVIGLAKDHGWHDHLVVPLYGVRSFGLGAVAARQPVGLSPDERKLLHLLMVYGRARGAELAEADPTAESAAPLTTRELECLRWVACGLSDWDIGERLNLSEATAHWHVENAKRKLDARTRAQAVATAIWCGLLAP